MPVDPAGLRVDCEGHIVGPAVGRLDRGGVAHEQVEAQPLGRSRVLVAPRQLGQVGHQAGQLLELDEDVVDQDRAVLGAELVDAADDFEVGAQTGERGPQLVRRVEDELALGATRRLERAEQAVEGPAQAAELVGASRVEAPRHVRRLGDVLHRVGERVERDERGAGDEPAQPDRQQHTGQCDCTEQQRRAW